MNLSVFGNDGGLGDLDFIATRDGFQIYQDSDTGDCYQLEGDEYVYTNCPVGLISNTPVPFTNRPPINTLPPVTPTLSQNNPFGVSSLSAGNLATVNVRPAGSTGGIGLLLLAGGLLFLMTRQ